MVTAANKTTSTGTDGDTNAAIYTPAAFSRTGSNAYLLGVVAGANVTADIPVIGGEGTWTRLAGGQLSSGGGTFYRLDVFGHQPVGSDASTNITINFATTQLGCSWSVIELAGVFNDSANNGAALWGNVVYDDTANTLQTSNTATLASGAVCTVVFAGQADNNGFDVEGTYTQVAEHISTSPLRTLTAGFLNAADTSVVATVTGAVTAKIGMVALGVSDGAAPSFTPPLLVTTPTAPDPVLLGTDAPVTLDPPLETTATVFAPVYVVDAIPIPVLIPSARSIGVIPTADLLEPSPTLGIRVDSFEWELLDKNLDLIGRVFPVVDANPTISASVDRSIMRTLDGIVLTGPDIEAINPVTERLRPWLRLQNGERFPLGVYLFGDHQRQVSTRADTWEPQMYDQALILEDETEKSFSVAAGAPLQPVMEAILIDVGITNFVMDATPAVASEPIAWPAGTARSRIVKDLAQMQGCLNPFFDNVGVFRCIPSPDPATVIPQFRYGPGRIDADSIVEADDSYRAPNRYIVIGSGSDAPIVGFYDIPETAPHSYANRGYRVSETTDLPGIADPFAAVLAARAAYLTDTRSWSRVTFTSPLDPRHDMYSTVEYDGALHAAEETQHHNGLFLEVGFRMELKSGGNHDHELTRLWGAS